MLRPNTNVIQPNKLTKTPLKLLINKIDEHLLHGNIKSTPMWFLAKVATLFGMHNFQIGEGKPTVEDCVAEINKRVRSYAKDVKNVKILLNITP